MIVQIQMNDVTLLDACIVQSLSPRLPLNFQMLSGNFRINKSTHFTIEPVTITSLS